MLYLPLGALNLPGSFGQDRTDFLDAIKLQTVHAFVTAGRGYGDPAQIAVEAALMKNAGIPLAARPSRPACPTRPGGCPAVGPPGSRLSTAGRHGRHPVRRAARRHPARLAGQPPGRAAGRPLTLAQLP